MDSESDLAAKKCPNYLKTGICRKKKCQEIIFSRFGCGATPAACVCHGATTRISPPGASLRRLLLAPNRNGSFSPQIFLVLCPDSSSPPQSGTSAPLGLGEKRPQPHRRERSEPPEPLPFALTEDKNQQKLQKKGVYHQRAPKAEGIWYF